MRDYAKEFENRVAFIRDLLKSSGAKGVKIMELRKGDRITGVVRLIEIEGQKKPENPEAEPSAETEQTSAPESSAGENSPEESGDHSTPAEEGTSPEPEQES